MNIRLAGWVVACVIMLFVVPAAAVAFDYSNTPGGMLVFDPIDSCYTNTGNIGCLSFTAAGGNSIQITSGSPAGLLGAINGVFGVGPITTSGLLQTADVSGQGSLSIFDGAHTLTAVIRLMDTFALGTIGGMNVSGTINLSSILYSGTNADLLALANAGAGVQTSSFQFELPLSLHYLFNTTGKTFTSFSGSIGAVPIPPSVLLFGSGVIGVLLVARREK